MRTEESSGGALRQHLRSAGSALRSAPADALALAMLGAGALAALGLLWLLARPPAVPAPADADHAHEHGDTVDGELALDGEDAFAPESEPLVVHVAGEVAAPGLYELDAGARVADALEAAGGPLPEAVLDVLNLARPLTDGEQLLVPDADGASDAGGAAAAAPGAVRADGLLDLNRASATELEELPGIGPVLAERIVSHREQNGPFQSVGDLRDVSGIGERRFQQLAELVTV